MNGKIGDILQVHQGRLEEAVQQIFPSDYVQTNSKSSSNIRSPLNGKFLELDVWVPEKNIAFEFQDEYHYVHSWYSQLPLSSTRKKDALKVESAQRSEVTIIIVPCWWDGQVESLYSSVCFYRPDLSSPSFVSSNSPTSFNPKIGFFKGNTIPGVGELMLASFPTSKIIKSVSPSNSWWMGEKYDGLRFCWNSDHKAVYSRSGLEIFLHSCFYDKFPSTYLDGEMWFGRGHFILSQKLLNIDPNTTHEWPFLRFPVFDIPSQHTENLPFEKRFESLLNEVSLGHSFLHAVSRCKCASRKILISFLRRIIKGGGEGIIFRKAKSTYYHGRSDSLLKLKAARGDIEALVEAETPTFYKLKLPNGNIIKAPIPKRKEVKPQKGDIVTIEYLRFSSTMAVVSPKIVRIRKDVIWEELVQSFARDGVTMVSHKALTKQQKRYFFEEFAKKNNFNAQVADHWYAVSRSSVLEAVGARKVLKYYNFSLVEALIDLFPEIRFDRLQFSARPHKYWQDPVNRRKLLETLARRKGLDPLLPDSWYSLSVHGLTQYRGVLSVLEYHQQNLAKAIVALFPEIGLQPSKFKVSGVTSVDNNQGVLDQFASDYNFDPLSPEDWYTHVGDLTAYEPAASLLTYYGNAMEAVMQIFPNIGLDKNQLVFSYERYWVNTLNRFSRDRGFDPLVPENWYHMTSQKYTSVKNLDGTTAHYPNNIFISCLCKYFPALGLESGKFLQQSEQYNRESNRMRSFFERIANQRGFDPRVVENWYQLKKSDFNSKGIAAISAHFPGGGVVSALLKLFPDLDWQVTRFSCLPSNFWQYESNRKLFFVHLAKSKGFDPLTQKWGNVKFQEVLNIKGGKTVLSYHSNSLTKALADLFPTVHFSPYYNDPGNRREFFVKWAHASGFDPLHIENWYSIRHKDIYSAKDGTTVLSHYGGNHKSALMRLFPELPWQIHRFKGI